MSKCAKAQWRTSADLCACSRSLQRHTGSKYWLTSKAQLAADHIYTSCGYSARGFERSPS